MGTLLVINSNMLFPRKLVAGSPGGIIDLTLLLSTYAGKIDWTALTKSRSHLLGFTTDRDFQS